MGMYRNKIYDVIPNAYDAETVDKILNEVESVIFDIIAEIESNNNYTKEAMLADLHRLAEDLY